MRAFTIVANWKMYFSYKQALHWLNHNKSYLTSIAHQHKLIICPSFEALANATTLVNESAIKLGAQDCSAYTSGAYTGQIQAASLKELGCSHVIIGHSEIRDQYHQTNAHIAQKLEQTLEHNLCPIIAIGEKRGENTTDILRKQLELLIPLLQQTTIDHCYVAYEPLWAIGTGHVPPNSTIENAFECIQQLMAAQSIKPTIKLLYGGSVSAENVETLKQIKSLNGFLIGAASTNIKQLQKISEFLSKN